MWLDGLKKSKKIFGQDIAPPRLNFRSNQIYLFSLKDISLDATANTEFLPVQIHYVFVSMSMVYLILCVLYIEPPILI